MSRFNPKGRFREGPDPSDRELLNAFGLTAAELENSPALRQGLTALVGHYRDPEALRKFGYTCIENGKLLSAARALERSLDLNPKQPQLYNVLHELYLEFDPPDFYHAEAALSRALGYSADKTSILIARGRLRLSRGNAREAIPDLEAAEQADPGNPALIFLLARAYFLREERKADYEERDYSGVIKKIIQGHFSTESGYGTYLMAALAYRAKGDDTSALQVCEEALKHFGAKPRDLSEQDENEELDDVDDLSGGVELLDPDEEEEDEAQVSGRPRPLDLQDLHWLCLKAVNKAHLTPAWHGNTPGLIQELQDLPREIAQLRIRTLEQLETASFLLTSESLHIDSSLTSKEGVFQVNAVIDRYGVAQVNFINQETGGIIRAQYHGKNQAEAVTSLRMVMDEFWGSGLPVQIEEWIANLDPEYTVFTNGRHMALALQGVVDPYRHAVPQGLIEKPDGVFILAGNERTEIGLPIVDNFEAAIVVSRSPRFGFIVTVEYVPDEGPPRECLSFHVGSSHLVRPTVELLRAVWEDPSKFSAPDLSVTAASPFDLGPEIERRIAIINAQLVRDVKS